VSLQRENRCFKYMKTGHIARNCHLLSTASDDSACEKLKSEEESSVRDVKMKTFDSDVWIAEIKFL